MVLVTSLALVLGSGYFAYTNEDLKDFISENYNKYSTEVIKYVDEITTDNLTEETEKAIEYADSLQDAIEEFEDSRTEINKEINQSTATTMTDLEMIKNSSLKDVVKQWAIRWDTVKEKFDDLNDYFLEVIQSSDQYFDKLFEIANKIQNEELRNGEIESNTKLKNDWIKVLKETKINIDKLKVLIQEGDDFYRVLLGASIREKLTENIGELNNISLKAEKLLSELQNLTEEGKKLAP